MIRLIMLHIHLKCSSNELWVLRRSLQMKIVNNVTMQFRFTEYCVTLYLLQLDIRQYTLDNMHQPLYIIDSIQQTVDIQTIDSRQQTVDIRQQTVDIREYTENSRQLTVDIQTVDSRQYTLDSKHQTVNLIDSRQQKVNNIHQTVLIRQ